MHQETARLLSDQAALSLDTISRDALNAGMNVQYTGANSVRGTIAATDKLTLCRHQESGAYPSQEQCTSPFSDGFYHAIVHTDVVYDLTSDAMWTDVSKYQDKGKTEVRTRQLSIRVKFFESTNAKVFTAETYLFGHN